MAKTLRQINRAGFTTKNSPLSNTEVDTNFIEMVDDILSERTVVATLTNKTINSPTITGQALFAQGSATIPSISFVNDGSPDTGLYHSGDGVFGVTCNTVPVATFKPTGAELLGVPTTQTAAVGTNTTQIATTGHVFAERAAIATLTNKTLTGAMLNGTLGATTRSTVAATTITATGTITGSNLSGTNTGDQSSVSGNAGTATILATSRTIGGVSFDGSANINLPGVNIVGTQSTTGNAATATSVAYTGLTGSVPTWDQSTTGNSATSTALQTARSIGGVAFNGSANINLPGVNIAGNQNTSGTASTAINLTGGRVLAGSGSAISPSIAFNDDAARDTGFFSPGDGRIAISTNGVYRGEFSPNGTLSIPSGYVGPGAAAIQGIMFSPGNHQVRAPGHSAAIAHVGVGHYRIYHNLNTMNYSVVANVEFNPANYDSWNMRNNTLTCANRTSTFFDLISVSLTSVLTHAGGNDNNSAPFFYSRLADFGAVHFAVYKL